MEIKVLYLYSDLMNLYGEFANLEILKRNLKTSKVKTKIDYASLNDKKEFNKYDLIYMGCGTEKNLLVALEDLKKDKDKLIKYIENNGVLLFTGNSYEIFGKEINDIEGLDILPFKVKNVEERTTTDVIFKSKLIDQKIVGFINNSSIITNNKNHLFDVLFSEEEIGKTEGIHYKNLFGTHITGPFLMRNPYFLKYLINLICKNKYKNFKLIDENYELLNQSYNLVLEELTNRQEKK